MQRLQTSWIVFFLYSASVSIISILLIAGMISSPSEPDSAILLGLSLPRLLITAGFFAAFVFSVFIAVRAWRNRAWAERRIEKWFGSGPLGQAVTWLAGISFGLGWIGCFLPFYRAGVLSVHWERLRPPMIFLLLVGLVTLAVALLRRVQFARVDRELASTYKLGVILFLVGIICIGLMLATDYGVYAPEDYWYGAGVPILISQLIAVLFSGVLFLQAANRWNLRQFDLLIALFLFLLTAVLWAREPLQRSFLFIGPYPPNRELYPFADAALYETASQFAQIGQNFLFYNGPFFERAVYASFLTYLHSLVGQDYEHVMAAQAAVFAVFPAIVYLIGRSLNSRVLGFTAALVATFRGANAIAASNMIDMANAKMMLTDFPTAIGVALLVLLAIEWLKQPGQSWHYALWMGGVVGLSIMLRTNALLFLPLIPLLALITFRRHWRPVLLTSSLFLLAVVAITVPWELRNQSLGSIPYGSYLTKFQSVIDLRYRPPAMPNESSLQKDVLSTLTLKSSETLLALYPGNEGMQKFSCNGVACFVPNHFLHNILTSILVLPTSLTFDDLRTTVRGVSPFWRPDWDGTFPNASFLLFALNLFFITFGIAVAWKKQRLIGLFPLAIFLIYNLSNGLARTSGGRYIVPVDWIMTVYFLLGAFQTMVVFAGTLGTRWSLFSEPGEASIPRATSIRQALVRGAVILAILFGLGALVPLAERVFPERYANVDTSEVLAEHGDQLARAGLDLQEIQSFLLHANAELSIGRALYPRYYPEFQGEVHFYPVVVMGFPRTTFTLIGPQGEQGIVLPGEKPDYLPHTADVLVLGCREQFYLDAAAVIVLDEESVIYTRTPESTLECPLRQPVCDNNHNCY
jgi:hypothetical protein